MPSATEIRAGAAYVELLLRDKLASQLTKAGERIRKWAASVRGLGMQAFGGELPGPIGDILRMAMSPAGAFAGFTAAAKQWGEAGVAMTKLVDRTGMAAENLSALEYAGVQTGVSMEEIAGGLAKMQKSLIDAGRGGAEQARALRMMNLEVRDFVGLNAHDQFLKLSDGIASIRDPALRTNAAMAILGRGAVTLFPLIGHGAAAVRELEDEAERLGFLMGGPEARAAHELADKFDRVGSALTFVKRAIGEAVAVMQGQMLDRLLSVALGLRDWIKNNQELVATIARVVAMIVFGGAALVAVGGVLSMVATMFTALATAASFAASVIGLMLGTWPGLAVTVLGGTAGAIGGATIGLERFGKAWDWLKAKLLATKTAIVESLGAIWNAASGGEMKLAWDVVKTGAEAVAKKIALAIKEAWVQVRDFISESLASAWDAFEIAGHKALYWLKNAWITVREELIGGLITLLEKLYVGLTRVFAGLAEVMANSITAMLAAMPKALGGISAEEAEDRRAAAAADRDSRIEAAKGAMQDIRGEREKAVETERADLTRELEKEVGKKTPMTGFFIEGRIQREARERREAAKLARKEELREPIAAAREAAEAWREALAAAKAVQGRPMLALPRPAIGVPFEGVEREIAAGTFSARAAEAMGRGGPMLEIKNEVKAIKNHLLDQAAFWVGLKIGEGLNVATKGVRDLKRWLEMR